MGELTINGTSSIAMLNHQRVITSYYLQYLIVKQMMRHCHVETMKGKNKANSGQIPILLDDGISSTSIA